ncbi:biotin transporter BioY [Bacillaceae bacterium]
MHGKTREITYVSLFVAFAVICAMLLRFGSNIVPFSLLPFVAVLAGAMLGKRLGAYALGAYVLLGLIGVPVFAQEPYGGIFYIFQPTFGFLLGFVAAAFVTGWILEKGRSLGRYIAATLAGIAVTYLIGLPYLWGILNLYLGKTMGIVDVLKIGFLPFIALDIVKAVVAAVVAKKVASHLPQTITAQHDRS